MLMTSHIDTALLDAVQSRLTLSAVMALGSSLGVPKAGTWQKLRGALHDEAAIVTCPPISGPT